MRRLIALLFAAVLVVGYSQSALAQDHPVNSPKAEFHLSNPLVVGTTTLQPGDYKFQCLFVDGKHVMVVTSVEDGREMARVPCTPEQISGKITISDFRSITRPDGTAAMTALRVKGETIAHRLILD